jgi:hypothetical protein
MHEVVPGCIKRKKISLIVRIENSILQMGTVLEDLLARVHNDSIGNRLVW